MNGQPKASANVPQRSPSRAHRCLPAALALLTAALAVWAWLSPAAQTIRGGHWLLAALTGRLSLACAAVICGCLAALVVLVRLLWRMGAAGRRKGVTSQGGSVMLEFALVFPFILLLVCTMVQSMLLMAGNLCVHYAAFCAAHAPWCRSRAAWRASPRTSSRRGRRVRK